MKLIYSMALAVIVAGTGLQAQAQEVYSDVMVADAVYHAEGGAKAQYYYGIRSVHYSDISEARRICIRTVKHARRDWIKGGSKGDFIEFLGARYCPTKGNLSISERKVNCNWVKNVKYWLKH